MQMMIGAIPDNDNGLLDRILLEDLSQVVGVRRLCELIDEFVGEIEHLAQQLAEPDVIEDPQRFCEVTDAICRVSDGFGAVFLCKLSRRVGAQAAGGRSSNIRPIAIKLIQSCSPTIGAFRSYQFERKLCSGWAA